MTKEDRCRLRTVVKVAVLDHDLSLLKRYMETDESPEARAAFCEAYRIYGKDPDVLVLYYESNAKLVKGDFKNGAEYEALQALYAVAEEEVGRAKKIAKRK